MSETERLIKAVREHPILYNTSHPEYTNCRKKEETWYNISESFEGRHEIDWKKKFKNLKDSYMKHLKSGNPIDCKTNAILKRYKSWPWASQMEFLKPFCKLKKTLKSNSSEKQWFELEDGVLSEDSLKGFPEDDILNPCEEQIDIKISPDPNNEQEFIESEIQHINVDRLSFDNKEEKSYSKATTKRKRANSPHNDIELILMGYAKTIKSFSRKRQTMVKFKFSQIIMEAELAQQEEDESNGPSAKKRLKNRAPSSTLSDESSN